MYGFGLKSVCKSGCSFMKLFKSCATLTQTKTSRTIRPSNWHKGPCAQSKALPPLAPLGIGSEVWGENPCSMESILLEYIQYRIYIYIYIIYICVYNLKKQLITQLALHALHQMHSIGEPCSLYFGRLCGKGTTSSSCLSRINTQNCRVATDKARVLPSLILLYR